MNYYREVSKMHGEETCWTFATQKPDGDDDNDGNFFMPTNEAASSKISGVLLKQVVVMKNA